MEPVRVLVVDDDERFAASVIALLDGDSRVDVAGWACNGADAYAHVVALPPDVITMDIDMPVLDGVEATRLIHARDPSIPIIVLSGSVSSARIEEALQAGANAHIAKTEAADHLIDLIIAAHTGTLAADIGSGDD